MKVCSKRIIFILLSFGLQMVIDILDQVEEIVPVVVAPFLIDLVDDRSVLFHSYHSFRPG